MSVGANSFAQSVSRNKTTQAQRVVAFPTQAAYAGNALLAYARKALFRPT